MLSGELIGLRARAEADIEAEMLNDVEMRVRADGRPWRPIAPGSALHRLQVETLADNHPMINAATRAGFTLEGTLRAYAWVDGHFADAVILGQLASEWSLLLNSPLR